MVVAEETSADIAKYGQFAGELKPGKTKHGVAGTVYIVDKSKLAIKGFSLDNKTVDAFFYMQENLNKTLIKVDFPLGVNEK